MLLLLCYFLYATIICLRGKKIARLNAFYSIFILSSLLLTNICIIFPSISLFAEFSVWCKFLLHFVRNTVCILYYAKIVTLHFAPCAQTKIFTHIYTIYCTFEKKKIKWTDARQCVFVNEIMFEFSVILLLCCLLFFCIASNFHSFASMITWRTGWVWRVNYMHHNEILESIWMANIYLKKKKEKKSNPFRCNSHFFLILKWPFVGFYLFVFHSLFIQFLLLLLCGAILVIMQDAIAELMRKKYTHKCEKMEGNDNRENEQKKENKLKLWLHFKKYKEYTFKMWF